MATLAALLATLPALLAALATLAAALTAAATAAATAFDRSYFLQATFACTDDAVWILTITGTVARAAAALATFAALAAPCCRCPCL